MRSINGGIRWCFNKFEKITTTIKNNDFSWNSFFVETSFPVYKTLLRPDSVSLIVLAWHFLIRINYFNENRKRSSDADIIEKNRPMLETVLLWSRIIPSAVPEIFFLLCHFHLFEDVNKTKTNKKKFQFTNNLNERNFQIGKTPSENSCHTNTVWMINVRLLLDYLTVDIQSKIWMRLKCGIKHEMNEWLLGLVFSSLLYYTGSLIN